MKETAKTPSLYYFTASYPYGLGEEWKKNELDVFSRHFCAITVLPFSYAGNFDKPKSTPDPVQVETPLFSSLSNCKKHVFKIIFSKRAGYYFREAFRRKVYKRKDWLVNWGVASIQTELAIRSAPFQRILKSAKADDIFYFYWGREWAYIIPFLRKAGFNNIFFRVHGYDIYEERSDGNNGYIPFRRPVYENAKNVLVLSQQASAYLVAKKYIPKERIVLAPLGTISKGLAHSSTDKVLRIASCSGIVAVKRLSFLAGALIQADIPVEWTHIGDGVLRRELEAEAGKFPPNVSLYITGRLPSDKILPYYTEHSFDLFVNVSSSEGMPVSIMEAFSAGIPVLATAVGGVPEMVSPCNSLLLSEDCTKEELLENIRKFYNLTAQQKQDMRTAAYKTYQAKYDAITNAIEVVNLFKKTQKQSGNSL